MGEKVDGSSKKYLNKLTMKQAVVLERE